MRNDVKNVLKLVDERIASGVSTVYPDRKIRYECFNGYILINHTCSVYITSSEEFVEMTPDQYDSLLHFLWIQVKRNAYYYNNTISLESEEAMDCFNSCRNNSSSTEPNIADLLSELMQDLPAKEKLIIIGIFYNDLTEKELAKQHNISQPTVNYYKHKAINRLAVMLTERGYTCEDFEF